MPGRATPTWWPRWPTLDDPRTRAAVDAERAVLATLEGGCSAPVGALAEVVEGDDGDELWVGRSPCPTTGRSRCGCPHPGAPADAAGVGHRLASEMLADGAARTDGSTSEEAERMTRGKTTHAPPPPTGTPPAGWVSFVGSGPGDPDLLTVRAVELLREAEVVVTEVPEHAALVRGLLGLPEPVGDADDRRAPAGPAFVDGGFGEDGQPLTHAARAKVVVRHAKSGTRVVRLMAGDPFLYASGPEEAQACVKAGIGFEIVPGVSSVTAVPAYAGIPLTTKDNREVAVVTCGDKVDWSRYADDRTLVLLSRRRLDRPRSPRRWSRPAAPAETPVAMTRVGTTTEQATVTSTLEHIAADARAARMAPPAVTVVGDVVDLRETLSWFETKPLFGWRVLVPRTKEQAGSLTDPAARLRRGARGGADHLGRAAAQPAADGQGRPRPGRGPLRVDRVHLGQRGQGGAREVRGVRPRRPRLLRPQDRRGRRQDRRRRSPPGACAPTWCRPASSPPPACWRTGRRTTSVLDPINRVFLPRADIATENLVAGLIDLGWECDDVTAYRTVRATPPPAPTRDAIKTGKFDAVVFTSSSTVRNLVGIAGKPHPSTVIAVIGPATAKTAEEHGLRVDVLAPKPDVEVLVDALADFGASPPGRDGRGRPAGHQAVASASRRARRERRADARAQRRLSEAAMSGDPEP